MEGVDGLAYAITGGRGAPVVYLHGWLANHTSWNRVRERLATRHPELVYDMRCHGDSDCTPFSMADLVDDLATVVQAADCDRPVLAGHSLGGMVALHYALEHDVSGLFLAGTCADTPEPVTRSPRWFLDRFGEIDRGEWADLILENYYGEETPDTIVEGSRQQLLDAGATVIRSGLQTMIDHDVRGSVAQIDAPCHVVGGRDDAAIVPAKVTALAERLGVDPVFLDAGHDLLHEIPDTTAAQLTQFLETAV